MGLKNILYFAIGALMLVACNDSKESLKYAKDIDSLLTELHRMDDSLNNLEIRQVQYLHDSLSRFYDTTEVRDTLDQRIRHLRHSERILNWYDNVHREITYSKSHLKAMKEQFHSSRLADTTKRKKT